MRTLDQLRPADSGVISALRGDGQVQQRLLEMGMIEGSRIEVLRLAPLGDPMEIRVQGYCLSLRKSAAALVQLEE